MAFNKGINREVFVVGAIMAGWLAGAIGLAAGWAMRARGPVVVNRASAALSVNSTSEPVSRSAVSPKQISLRPRTHHSATRRARLRLSIDRHRRAPRSIRRMRIPESQGRSR